MKISTHFYGALLVTTVIAGGASAWTFLGTVGGEISAPSDVYVLWNQTETLGEGQFAVTTLTVYPHSIAGIDVYDSKGGLVYDTRYPHRSYIAVEVYDCANRMTALIRSIYYSGETPSQATEVFDLIEDKAIFVELISDIPSYTLVFDRVCAPPRWPQ